jgi:hypothetical protein
MTCGFLRRDYQAKDHSEHLAKFIKGKPQQNDFVLFAVDESFEIIDAKD